MRLFRSVIVWILAGGACSAAPASVIALRVDDAIHPVTAAHIAAAVTAADPARHELVVIELDTPGGTLAATRDITTAILNSRVPVAVFVAPSGAQAASAGFLILMAADIAAMAPGTNTGAAHPVGLGGEDAGEVMEGKIVNDTAAMARTLAAKRGRNVAAAERAVRSSDSWTETEAVAAKLADVVAPNLAGLLQKLDGRPVARAGGGTRPLRLAAATIEWRHMGRAQKLMAALANPNIVYVLMMIGMVGLYAELTHPGAIFPGVVGAISLLLAFAGLSVLPVSGAGAALLVLAAVLFVAEIKITSHGLLGAGAVAAFVIGSLMLIDGPIPELRISPALVLALGAAAAAVVAFLTYLVMATHQRKPVTGDVGIIGEVGVARTDLAPAGKVFLHGEIWDAEAGDHVARGEKVEAVAINGLTLKVRRTAG